MPRRWLGPGGGSGRELARVVRGGVVGLLMTYVGEGDVDEMYDKLTVPPASPAQLEPSSSSSSSGSQAATIVCVAQASGAGKTKLSFMVGKDRMPTVIIRLWNQTSSESNALAGPWRIIDGLLLKLKFPSLHSSDDERNIVGTLLFRGAFASYVEWNALVLQRFLAAWKAKEPDTPVTPAQVRYVVLMANRNGRGDEVIKKIFEARFSDALTTERSRLEVRVKNLERAAAQAWKVAMDWMVVAGMDAATVATQMATVHVALDEVQVFRGRYGSVFFRAGGTKASDGLRGLLDAAIQAQEAVLLWRFSMSGTEPGLVQWMQRQSPVQQVGTLRSIVTGRFMAVGDMVAQLCELFQPVYAHAIVKDPAVLRLLKVLQGRAAWFFRWGIHFIAQTLVERLVDVTKAVVDALKLAGQESAWRAQ